MTARMLLGHLLRDLLPHRVVRYRDDVRRYRRWGLPEAQARRLARDRPARADLEETGWYLLPAAMLPGLTHLVDVGAHVGAWCAAMLRHAAPRRILAFEPAPATFARLAAQPWARDPRVRLLPHAVGAAPGELTLHLTSHPSAHSALAPRPGMNAHYGSGWDEVGAVRVPMTTLDRELADWDEVSLLKVDVQGYEPQVLAGAARTLARTRALMIEANLVPHYRGELPFWDLHRLLGETYGLALYNISDPFRSLSGRSLWVDAVYLPAASPFLAEAGAGGP
jgi:FkbM family methyltransferase